MTENVERLLTTEQLGERWAMDPGTIENWRNADKGPVFLKMGDAGSAPVRYRLSDIIAYEKEKERP